MQNKGFTLIEILVVIGIMTVIISFGMSVNFGAFTSGTLQSEGSKIVSLLERARSHAMANMFQTTYGVCYDDISKSYVIFRGGSCNPNVSTSELISANTNIAIASNFSNAFPTVVFDQLSGNVNGAIPPILVMDSFKSLPLITINNEGTINW